MNHDRSIVTKVTEYINKHTGSVTLMARPVDVADVKIFQVLGLVVLWEAV